MAKLYQRQMDFDLHRFEQELAFLVNIDSGSRCLDGVNRIADWFADRLHTLGWTVRFVQEKPDLYGKSVYAVNGSPGPTDLLILSHIDTVYPEGTAAGRPFSRTSGTFTGPGVADMKAGCLMALHAFEQLQENSGIPGHIGFFLNGEHELSCPTTRPFIEEISRDSRVVIATEPARMDGSCVSQRKGILRYRLQFKGKSAHSGVNPQNGACAVTEMASVILYLKGLEDPASGITVNPGLVTGGTSVNIVPDLAECQVDVRVVEMEDADRIDRLVRERVLNPVNRSVRSVLEGGITRPPLVPTERSRELISGINGIARNYEVDLKWSFSGGGSDASFASAFGIPALCGMGPVGGHYHSEQEYLQTVDLQERLCIFRDTVAAICRKEF